MRVPLRATVIHAFAFFFGAIVSATMTGLAAEVLAPPSALSDLPVLESGAASAATNLTATVACSQTELRKGIAALSWSVGSPPGNEQRIEVSFYDFTSGQSEFSDPLPPEQTSLVWDRVHGRAIHVWRVLTRHAAGWAPSETAQFEGLTCVADSGPPTTPPAP